MSNPLVTFRFGVESGDESEEFLARTANLRMIDEVRRSLAMPVNNRMHIHGKIERAVVGENLQWHWKFVDSDWILSVPAIDLCNSLPSYVESHLEEWLGRCFCPWLAFVKAEVTADTTGSPACPIDGAVAR